MKHIMPRYALFVLALVTAVTALGTVAQACTALTNGVIPLARFNSAGTASVFTQASPAAVEGTIGYDTVADVLKSCDGTNWNNVGAGGNSGVTFNVYKTSAQSISAGWQKVTWNLENFDTNNNFASDRFTPTVAGKYFLSSNVRTSGVSGALIGVAIYKNGVIAHYGTSSADFSISAQVSAVVDANGAGDYFEVFVYTNVSSSVYVSDIMANVFSGFLIGGGGGGGGGGTPGGANTQVQFNNSGAFGGSANFTWNNSTNVLDVTGSQRISGNTASELAINDNAGQEATLTFQDGGTAKWQLLKTSGNDFGLYNYTTSSSSLFVKASNGNVGIGTASPGTSLVVVNNANSATYNNAAQIAVTNNAGGTNFSRLLFGQVSTNKMFIEAADQANTKGDLLLQPYGGNVGIGTTAPGSKLTIVPSTVAGDGLSINRQASGATNASYWGAIVSNASALDAFVIGQSSTTYTTGGTLGWVGNDKSFLYYPAELRIGTGTGATPTMVLNTSGHVGLGLTPKPSTTSVLQTAGDLTMRGAGAQTVHFNSYFSGTWKAYDTGFAAAARFDNTTGKLGFWTSPASVASDANSNVVERMTIDKDGNVGIGATGPNTALDVAGAFSVRGMAAPAVSPAGQGRIYFDSTSNVFRVSQNGGAYTNLVGGGASALSGLSDVTITSVANNDMLRYNTGTSRWVNVGMNTALGTTTMVPNWPDAIRCVGSAGSSVLSYSYGNAAGTTAVYTLMGDYGGTITTNSPSLSFASVGAAGSLTETASWLNWATDCGGQTVAQLYAAGKAFNFIGSAASTFALNNVLAASGINTIANGVHAQTWNWALTGTGTDAFTFGETTAATGGTAGDQSILKATTLANSTATPLIVTNLGNGPSFEVNDETGDTDSTPFIITAAGNVGIATTAPGELLQVGNANNPATARIVLASGQSGGPNGRAWDIGTAYGAASVADPFYDFEIRDRTANATRLLIDYATGNIGIGTASPGRRLSVLGNGIIAGNTTSSAGVLLQTNGTAGEVVGINHDNNAFNALQFSTSGSPSMFISTGGNVGIGTSSPNSPLHVSRAHIASFTGATTGAITLDGTYTNGNFNAIDFTHNDSAPFARIAAQHTGSGTYLAFGTSNNYGTGITNQAMTIDPNGNVGIGSALTAPTEKLHVDGAIRVGASHSTNVANAGVLDATGGVSRWFSLGPNAATRGGFHITGKSSDGSLSTTYMLIDTNGNVGINAASPNYKLDVQRAGTETSGGRHITARSYVNVSPASASTANQTSFWSQCDVSGSSNINANGDVLCNYTSIGVSNTGTINMAYGNYNDIVKTAGGTLSNAFASHNVVSNTGGGTIGSGYGAYGVVQNGGSGSITLAEGLRGLAYNYGSGNIADMIGARNYSQLISTGDANNMYGTYSYVSVDNAGAVTNQAFGVRTGVGRSAGTITNGYGLYIDDTGATNDYGIWQHGADDDNYFAGKVGIGVTNPTHRLHVENASADSYVYISSPLANQSGVVFADLTNGVDWHLYRVDGSRDISFWNPTVGNVIRMMQSTGRVGIGTASPAYRLSMASPSAWASGGTQLGFCVDTGCLTGYPATAYPVVKTDSAYIYFDVNGAYAGYVSTGGFNNVSSRTLKENFEELDYDTVLRKIDGLQVMKWNYKTDDDSVKHIGPFAEDFHEAFGLNGADNKAISDSDRGGVALAGVKGLITKVKALEAENAALKARLDAIEAKLLAQ